jgi:rhodanese-related sulfurtransferase
MRHWFSKLTLNQRLALLAFVLGAVALGATPTRQGSVTLSPRDLGLIVQREADHISVQTLADDLVKGQAGYRVIDVRGEAAFNAYHVPTAESIPIAALASADLPRNERLLLYGDDGVHAAQAWFLLRAKGYQGVYVLRGGVAAWNDEILHPALVEPATLEQRRENEQRAAVAAFFGGSPRAAAGAGTATSAPVSPAPVASATPAVAPPLQTPAGGAKPKAAAARKKEGC